VFARRANAPSIAPDLPATSSQKHARVQQDGQNMEAIVKEDRIELRRTEDEKKSLITRLNRIEGQVRGIKTMIEEDRHCQDEVQQIGAATAALREVALLLISQHSDQSLQLAMQPEDRDLAMNDITQLLRAAMRLCE
jgi:DNA-binding FrmR family transcriptional regulator